MILHGDTLISEDVIEAKFICDIQKCKGACCIEGDRGAPIDEDEIEQLKVDLEAIKPHLSPEGIAWIEEHGFAEKDPDGGFATTCLPDGKCSFVVEAENGLLSCGIENAYHAGDTSFLKPISCHLYPIRVNQYSNYHALNYHEWNICSAACSLGAKEGVRVYEFLKTPLIRKFGEDWYTELSQLAEAYLSNANKTE